MQKVQEIALSLVQEIALSLQLSLRAVWGVKLSCKDSAISCTVPVLHHVMVAQQHANATNL